MSSRLWNVFVIFIHNFFQKFSHNIINNFFPISFPKFLERIDLDIPKVCIIIYIAVSRTNKGMFVFHSRYDNKRDFPSTNLGIWENAITFFCCCIYCVIKDSSTLLSSSRIKGLKAIMSAWLTAFLSRNSLSCEIKGWTWPFSL